MATWNSFISKTLPVISASKKNGVIWIPNWKQIQEIIDDDESLIRKLFVVEFSEPGMSPSSPFLCLLSFPLSHLLSSVSSPLSPLLCLLSSVSSPLSHLHCLLYLLSSISTPRPDVIKQNRTLTDLNRPQVGVRFGQGLGVDFSRSTAFQKIPRAGG
jgi:hypothetical protein